LTLKSSTLLDSAPQLEFFNADNGSYTKLIQRDGSVLNVETASTPGIDVPSAQSIAEFGTNGTLKLSSCPVGAITDPKHVATREYVSQELNNLSSSIVSGTVTLPYIRKDISSSVNFGVSVTFQGGGEIRGLPNVPSTGSAAASKTYVDIQDASVIAQINNLQSNLTGGALALPYVRRDVNTTMNSNVSITFQGGGEIRGLPNAPATNNSAVARIYLNSNFYGVSGVADAGRRIFVQSSLPAGSNGDICFLI